jgi:cyclomaltodextrinase
MKEDFFMAKDTPKWLKNCVIYEVFTRNFANAGTFNDVYNDLERIKALGVDIVWLMPFLSGG